MKKVVVIAFGAWDMLHFGHIKFLESAKKFGDTLIVGVQSDESYFAENQEYPFYDDEVRRFMVSSLKCVDMAIEYKKLAYIPFLKNFDVDVMVISDEHTEERYSEAEKYMKDNGKRIVRLSRIPEISTSIIKGRLTGMKEGAKDE